jgi:hypothetical protein
MTSYTYGVVVNQYTKTSNHQKEFVMKRSLLSLLCAVALSAPLISSSAFAGTATSSALLQLSQQSVRAVEAPDPAQQWQQWAQLFRRNDLLGLVRSATSEAEFNLMRSKLEAHRSEHVKAEDVQEINEKIARLTAPGAVAKLMEEIEPKLAEARPKAQGAIMIGLGALSMAATGTGEGINADDRENLKALLPAIQQWATSTDFLSDEAMRAALEHVVQAARQTGVSNFDQLRSLSLEDSFAKAGIMLAGAKRSLKVYGIDLDAMADSLRVETLSVNGDVARVRTTITVLNTPISKELELKLVDGRWIGGKTVVAL